MEELVYDDRHAFQSKLGTERRIKVWHPDKLGFFKFYLKTYTVRIVQSEVKFIWINGHYGNEFNILTQILDFIWV